MTLQTIDHYQMHVAFQLEGLAHELDQVLEFVHTKGATQFVLESDFMVEKEMSL